MSELSARLRAIHMNGAGIGKGYAGFCQSCSNRWPCPAILAAAEIEVLERVPRCDSCGARLGDPDANHCHGCGKAICFLCVEAFGHVADGAHGVGDPSDWWNDRLGERDSLRRQLAQHAADTERLDWLQRLVLSCVGDPLDEVCITREPDIADMKPYVGYQIRVRGDCVGDFGPTLRAAIDSARKVEEPQRG